MKTMGYTGQRRKWRISGTDPEIIFQVVEMEHTTGYEVTIFGQITWYESEEYALKVAQDANYRYANGFVQVHDCKTGEMIFGINR